MADSKLVEFLISQGHSEERAQQIAENHPDAVRADLAKAGTEIPKEPDSEHVPDLASFKSYLDHVFEEIGSRIADLRRRHERLVDHVNREIGVAGDAPLIERIGALEAAVKQKGASDGKKEEESAPQQEGAVPQT